MKRFSLGPEPQLGTIVLLVFAPILFGLWMIVFGSVSAFVGMAANLVMHPADEPFLVLLLLLWTSAIPRAGEAAEEGAVQQQLPTDALWFVAVGVLIGLAVADSELQRPAGIERNLAAYAAIAAATLHFVVAWTRPSERTLSLAIKALVALCFVSLLLYLWLIEGAVGTALFFALVVVGLYCSSRLNKTKAEFIDYRRR